MEQLTIDTVPDSPEGVRILRLTGPFTLTSIWDFQSRIRSGTEQTTIVDFTDTWVRAAIPETQADHIGIGDTLRIKLPGGTVTSGKVFFKSAEADFATQRDVSRSKRDIKTIVVKVRLDNPKAAYVPGMTADVLVSPAQLRGTASSNASASGAQP